MYSTWISIVMPISCAAFCTLLVWISKPRPPLAAARLNKLSQKKAKHSKNDHELVSQFSKVISSIGGGSWPPQASYGPSWPKEIQPYHRVYQEMSQFLAVNEADVSLDDCVNTARITEFRTKMSTLLQESIDISAVTALLSDVEGGKSFVIGPAEYNGFYACIALSRHAFRWGVIPVVAAAQREQFINFPPELALPWPYISRRYGVTSLGGNMMSNYFYNVDKGNVIYEINRQKDAHIRQAEYEFANIFAAIELKATPVYCHMVDAVLAFERGDVAGCLRHVQSINKGICEPLKVFSETVVEKKISRTIWMPYVQGFQGWAAGEMIEGKYVEYDGLSGNQLPFFHMIDAFLGLEPYLTEESLQRYIPKAQRDLQTLFRRHSFRVQAQKCGLDQIETEMTSIVQRLRIFRAAHRSRVAPYIDVPAPERLIMTAGKSVLEGRTANGTGVIGSIADALRVLMPFLDRRLKETR